MLNDDDVVIAVGMIVVGIVIGIVIVVVVLDDAKARW